MEARSCVVQWSVDLADNSTEIPAIVLRQTIIRDLFEEFSDIQCPNDDPKRMHVAVEIQRTWMEQGIAFGSLSATGRQLEWISATPRRPNLATPERLHNAVVG
jgi:hypothetical protein